MASNPPQLFGCYIGNIDRQVTKDILMQLFSQCGTIVDCSLNGSEENPYRYGFIDFATEDERKRAMKFDSFPLAGRKLKVNISKGNVNKPDPARSTPQPPANTFKPEVSSVPPVIAPGASAAGSMPPQAPPQFPMNPGQPPDMMGYPYPAMHSMIGGMAPAPLGGWAPGAGPMMGGMPGMFGGPMGGMMPGRPMPFHPQGPVGFGPANPPPSAELREKRAKQREKYLELIREDALKYEASELGRKRGERDGDSENRDDGSNEDVEEKSSRKKGETEGEHTNELDD